MGPMLVAGIAALVGVVGGMVVRRRFVFVTQVRSCSMSPSLRPGQRLLTFRVRGARIARGDVVAVDSAELGQVIVKRVIGEPEDRVLIDESGRVRINGAPLAEPYVATPAGPAGSFAVPPGHYLLLGDNRAHSSDSRAWRQPFIPRAAIRGKVWIVRGQV